MKVLHVYKTYYPDTFGGVEKFIQTLSKGMMKKGIKSAVFCLTHERTFSEIEIEGVRVYKIPHLFSISSTPISFKAFFKFRKIVKDFDIVHYHFPYPFQDLLFLFFGMSKKSMVTYHSDIIKQKILYFFYKPLEVFFLKRVGKIIATSQNYVETSPILQKYKSKINVISLSIDEKKYPFTEKSFKESYRKQFGEKFFLFIGVLRYYKGLHTLINAAKKTGFSVVIAGSGPLENDLKKQAAGYKNIHFMGDITDQEKVNLLSSCYAFVFSSHLRSEAFGLSLLEASMHQKPMITCEIGTGTSFINLHNETGLVISPNDSDALSTAMTTLFKDGALSQQFGENAYKRYLDLFTIDKMVDSYEEIYRSFMRD
jgi:glycosyltransferase involved in cell wall biosynthesis